MSISLEATFKEVAIKLEVSYSDLLAEIGLWGKPPTESDLIQALSEYDAMPKVEALFTGLEVSDFYNGYAEMLRPDAFEHPKTRVEIILAAFDLDMWRDMDGTKYELICAGLSVMKPAWFVVFCIKYAVDLENGA